MALAVGCMNEVSRRSWLTWCDALGCVMHVPPNASLLRAICFLGQLGQLPALFHVLDFGVIDLLFKQSDLSGRGTME
ncbi:hypothetical protein, partial [Bifidobacterium sp. UTCIF-1]|uniref:hypothetical protein n=1 Tax=Bifidobacterium sp. UTCIF-1 TaxID=1465255 RepID=UPI001C6125BA